MANIDLVNPCGKIKAKQSVAIRDKLPQLMGLCEGRTPRKSNYRIATADNPWVIIMRHPGQNTTYFQITIRHYEQSMHNIQ